LSTDEHWTAVGREAILVGVTIDRAAWLRERRAAVEADYDADAPTYDTDMYRVSVHVRFIDSLLATCPLGGLVLDAPCGTGQYFAQVAASGRRVVGADQSAGMLAQARARGIAERLEHVGLQELAFDAEFDSVMTVDAMEHVPPEDWPLVVANLRRATRPHGHLYMTLEETDEAEVEEQFQLLAARGLPVVPGEVIEGDSGGYHFYPGRERALDWLAGAGFQPTAEEYDDHDGWGYRHLLLRTD
jgi:SAM-dependent methyltransferase